MAGRYAAKTTVPVERTRDEIERTLARYGARAFSYGWDGERSVVMFEAQGRRIRFDVLAADKDGPQQIRQRWRALLLVIKAKLEAVAAGISTFEEEFLANVVLPDGSKVSDWMAPQLEEVYTSGQMPELLPGARAALPAGGPR